MDTSFCSVILTHQDFALTSPQQSILMRLPFTDSPSFSPSSRGTSSQLAAFVFSWQSLGIVIFAVMLARWVWIFAAPADMAMPAATSWQKSEISEDLFGHAADVNAVASAGNIKLIGVFAHKTAGFAVLQIDGKQVGVGMGESVAAGLRLVETHANHVLLERGGVKQRVDLQVSSASSGITTAPSADGASTASVQEAMPRTTDLEAIPPAQRAAMQQELDNFRRRR